MSNPQTFFIASEGEDLSNIFQPYLSGDKATVTGYKIPDGRDLSDIFAKYITSNPQANLTNFKVNDHDLNEIFQKKINAFPTTNQLYTSSVTFSNFNMPSGTTKFNFSLCGSGGNGYTTNTTTPSYGGGGSGAWIQALNIPYILNSSYISSISINIGGESANTTVTIRYGNNTYIQLIAGGGVSATAFSGNTGGLGGTSAITNTTIWSSANYSAIVGKNGGNYNQSGTSSGKTTSGSGATSTTTISSAGPAGSFSLGSITVTSQGGGSNAIVSGYGAGGASTPANYNTNAPAYRYGTYGCCIIYCN